MRLKSFLGLFLLFGAVARPGAARDRISVELSQAYAVYNCRFFRCQLPENVLVFWKKNLKVDRHPSQAALWSSEDYSSAVILVDARWQRAEDYARLLLLHEMAHLKTRVKDDDAAEFEREMERLAAAGAFKGLW